MLGNKLKNGLFLSTVLMCSAVNAQTDVLIKVIEFPKLPAVPYVEKTKEIMKQESQIRTFVPIYSKNHMNNYASLNNPLPLYGGWYLNPIDRYGCRRGDIVLVNARGGEKRFPIKTDRNEKDAKDWDKVEPLDCSLSATPKILNSWIMNTRYIAFETSDPGFVLFDFIKGEFVKVLVMSPSRTKMPLQIKTALDGSVYLETPGVSAVDKKRFFLDENGQIIKAPVDQSIHKYAFAYREMYMCQEALSLGETCTNQEQLKKLFLRKN